MPRQYDRIADSIYQNLTGEREVPDHPLIHQTIRDCLEEAMDLERLGRPGQCRA